MCLLEYRGLRLLATSVLPIGSKNPKYGNPKSFTRCTPRLQCEELWYLKLHTINYHDFFIIIMLFILGSKNGGRLFFKENKELNRKMKAAAKRINIAGHRISHYNPPYESKVF
jgi:hypothetical protein